MGNYTINEISKKLGIHKRKVWEIVKAGKVKSTREEGASKPYQIPKTELKKIEEIVNNKGTTKEKKRESNSKVSIDIVKNNQYEDFLEMQKILIETMHNLSITQNKIAETLAFLSKKIQGNEK